MALRLIINADDMGMTPGVTKGIVDCMTEGIVSSATLMINMPSAAEAARLALEHGLAVGLHLNLTTGTPVSRPIDIPSLVRADGSFHSHAEFKRRLMTMRISLRDVEHEFSSQVAAARALGLLATHIDTHHHLHLWIPVARAMQRVGRRHGINKTRTTRTTDMAIRISATGRSAGLGWAKRRYKTLGAALLHRWFRMPTWRMEPSAFRKPNEGRSALQEWLFFVDQLKQLPGDTTVEVPCHPAYVDDELSVYASYVGGREDEISALTSPELKAAVAQAGIQLISFRDL